MFDLVIFDCDGVLVDSEAISARMLIAEMSDRGVRIDAAYVARHFLGRSYPVVMRQIRRDFGITLPQTFEAQYRARLLAAFDDELRPMPGAAALAARLRCDYCVATSSSPARVDRSLRITGLHAAFADRATTASEVRRGKPAPDLFELAAAKRGVAPDRCLVIEDSENGIAAARAAGMEVWRFTGGSHLEGPQTAAGAARTFASFDEFPQLAPDLVTPDPAA